MPWNGNLHTMLIKGKNAPLKYIEDMDNAANQIYDCVIKLNGTISGEHGIGLIKTKYLPKQFSSSHLSLMKSIKKVFDPNNLLNPGKMF